MSNGEQYPYLQIGDDKGEVRYLGYRIAVSPCEYEIIRILYYAEKPLVKHEIVRRADGEVRVSEGGVAVHICALNKKISCFGGRRLVEYEFGRGYYLNPNM